MSTSPSFAEQVRAYRTGLRLSQAALGEAIGTDQATVSRIENGAEPSKPARILLERLMAEAATEAAS